MRRRAQSGQQPRGAASTTPNPLPAPSPRPSPARAPSPSSPRFPLQSSPGSPTPPALYRWAARGETQERPDDHKPTYRLRVYGVEDPLQTPRQCSRAPSTGVLQGQPELTSQLALSDTGIKSTTRGCRSLPPLPRGTRPTPGLLFGWATCPRGRTGPGSPPSRQATPTQQPAPCLGPQPPGSARPSPPPLPPSAGRCPHSLPAGHPLPSSYPPPPLPGVPELPRTRTPQLQMQGLGMKD